MVITLRHGALTAQAETLGGELVSLRREGTEYIWSGDPAYWSGRNPLLFPIVGALKNGVVDIGGQSFAMARHGFAWRKEFETLEQGTDFVTFRLREDDSTLEQYPFPFDLRVCHRLTETGFVTAFTVTNTGEVEMPFCIGAHTAFRCPLAALERFEDYRLVFDEPETMEAVCPGEGGCLDKSRREDALREGRIDLDHPVFDRVDTLIYEGLRSKTVALVHKDTGRGVEVDFSQFPMVAFWTMPGANAPYLCIEPWQGCAALTDESGRFTDKPHCVTLRPSESWTRSYTVRLLG